jgi:hypothetical protein
MQNRHIFRPLLTGGRTTNKMNKQELIRNVGIVTIPVCIIIFAIGWFIFRNIIGAAILPLLLFIASVHNNFSKYFDDKKKEAAGVIKRKFKSRKAYDLVAPNDSVAPSLCIEIEDNRYLLLNGQWLYDEETYGEESREYYDEESETFNCYRKPFSFPSTEFEVWISNLDKQPQKIIILGDYIEPKEVRWSTPEEYCNEKFAVIEKHELIVN